MFYLSLFVVWINVDNEVEIMFVGFVIGLYVLVMVCFVELLIFDEFGRCIGFDDSFVNGMCVFISLLEVMVDWGVDVLEYFGVRVDGLFWSVFRGGLVCIGWLVCLSWWMCEVFENVGELVDCFVKVCDVLMGVGCIVFFVGDVVGEWVMLVFRKWFEVVLKDVVLLSDYEMWLLDKIQFLFDVVFGFINIQQNELFKILIIVFVVGVLLIIMVGIWGMNFKYMFEFDWIFGYFLVWFVIIVSGIVLLVWFKWCGWFEQEVVYCVNDVLFFFVRLFLW